MKLEILQEPTACVFNEKEDLLRRILQSNYTRALLKVRSALTELHTLIADAPKELPVDDKVKLLNFVKKADKEIGDMIY